MTDSDLERQLRDHYSSLDAGPAGRATSRVSTALNGAPSRRWGPAGGAVAMVAAAAVLAVVLVPVWSHNRGPAANPTSTGPAATATYNSAVANARVKLAGITKQGLVWTQLATAIAISTDHGHAWSDIALPQDTVNAPDRTIDVLDRDHAWVLRESPADPQVFRTSDGGASWLSADLPVNYNPATGVPIGRLSFIDVSVGFVVIGTNAEAETVLRTQDGGATWAVTGRSATLESVANTLWAARTSAGSGANQLLRVSRDAGATWTDVPLPGLNVQSTCVQPAELWVPGPGGVAFLSATEGYAAVSCTEGNFGTRYYRTTDAGLSWSQIAAMTRPVGIAPVFVDATHWFQPGVAEADLQATADGGKTWTTLAQNGLAGSPIYWLDTRDGTNGAAVDGGANGALFLTWDGGRTWQPADFAAR
jgi:photosystem II stability/assembly factor-like uncharacterized protein